MSLVDNVDPRRLELARRYDASGTMYRALVVWTDCPSLGVALLAREDGAVFFVRRGTEREQALLGNGCWIRL